MKVNTCIPLKYYSFYRRQFADVERYFFFFILERRLHTAQNEKDGAPGQTIQPSKGI